MIIIALDLIKPCLLKPFLSFWTIKFIYTLHVLRTYMYIYTYFLSILILSSLHLVYIEVYRYRKDWDKSLKCCLCLCIISWHHMLLFLFLMIITIGRGPRLKGTKRRRPSHLSLQKNDQSYTSMKYWIFLLLQMLFKVRGIIENLFVAQHFSYSSNFSAVLCVISDLLGRWELVLL